MAKNKDLSGKLIAWFILFSIASAIWTWMKETYTQITFWVSSHLLLIEITGAALVIGAILVAIAVNGAKSRQHQMRIKELLEKYGDESVVEKILNNNYWIGATEEMLLDSIGEPDDKDSSVMKTKTKETWKYGKKQANQYRLRIYLDNGRVTRWESKE